jgi:hypothetical protein
VGSVPYPFDRQPKDRARAPDSNAINKWIIVKETRAAARNGYRIVRICLPNALPIYLALS